MNSWSRSVARCPHCGLTTFFDAEGVCPACRIAGDAPVTDEDTARIAREVNAAERRRIEGDRPRRGRSSPATGFALAGLGVVLTFGSFAVAPNAGGIVFTGLIAGGLWMAMRDLAD